MRFFSFFFFELTVWCDWFQGTPVLKKKLLTMSNHVSLFTVLSSNLFPPKTFFIMKIEFAFQKYKEKSLLTKHFLVSVDHSAFPPPSPFHLLQT